MANGVQALFPWGSRYGISDEDHNKVMEGMVKALSDEFLPRQQFKPNNSYQGDWGLRPRTEAENHYFVFPNLIQPWVKKHLGGSQDTVFLMGPFCGNPTDPDKKGIVVFCCFEHTHEVREFFREMAEFLERKVPQIASSLNLEARVPQ